MLMSKVRWVVLMIAVSGCTSQAPPGYAPGTGNVYEPAAPAVPAKADNTTQPSEAGVIDNAVQIAAVERSAPWADGAAPMTDPIAMRVGPGNRSLDYQDSSHSKFRTLVVTMHRGFTGWPDGLWTIYSADGAHRFEDANAISTLGFDGKAYTYTLDIGEPFFGVQPDKVKFHWVEGNQDTDTIAFVGADGKHYVATIVYNFGIHYNIESGPPYDPNNPAQPQTIVVPDSEGLTISFNVIQKP
jgi:hypothetical protein